MFPRLESHEVSCRGHAPREPKRAMESGVVKCHLREPAERVKSLVGRSVALVHFGAHPGVILVVETLSRRLHGVKVFQYRREWSYRIVTVVARPSCVPSIDFLCRGTEFQAPCPSAGVSWIVLRWIFSAWAHLSFVSLRALSPLLPTLPASGLVLSLSALWAKEESRHVCVVYLCIHQSDHCSRIGTLSIVHALA